MFILLFSNFYFLQTNHKQHLYQMGRYTLMQPIKVPVKKQKKKCPSANKTTESNKRLPKPAKLQKNLSKDYERNQTDLQILYSRNKSNGSSLKNLKTNKVHNIHCSNPQIRIRKTIPCVYRNSSSIQYPKQLSLNSKEKLKQIVYKQSKGSREKDVKVSKEKAKIGLAIMKNIKIKEYLSLSNEFKKEYPCQKPQRQQRKTTQALLSNPKTSSKSKLTTNQTLHHPQQPKPSHLPSHQPKPIHQSKSSCITRNISRNNSKQKEYYHETVGEKFKKKRGKEEKKLRKQAVYTSMKISRRNSLRFVESGEGYFIVVDGSVIREGKGVGMGKQKEHDLQCELWKTKSFRNLDLLNVDGVDFEEQFIECDPWQQKRFSFKKNPNNPINNNPHQLSIENFLQCTQQPFHLQSQQSLKQRLTKLSLSLQQLRQQQFPNFEQLQSLNEYQTTLSQNMHFPIAYPLTILPIKKPISDRLEKHRLIQRAHIIDWLSIMVSTMLLKTESFQLAVAYLDEYCYGESGEEVTNEQARLVAIACLTLAIKMNQRELEHDIFNAYQTLQAGFRKEEIVKTQRSIAKRLKLNLNIPTLSLFLDYLTSLWDSFLDTHSNPFSPPTNLYFRSLNGRSYQNYRRALEICNSIIMDALPQQYHFTQIILSIMFVICKQNLQRVEQQRVFERIDNFGRSLQRSTQRSSQGQGKENIPTFATQETLDGLLCSGVKENRVSFDNNPGKSHIPEGKDGKLLEALKQQNEQKDPQHTIQKFVQTFSTFVKSSTNQDIHQIDKAILYVQQLSQLKFLLQVDPRIYQQAQTYEEFMRYHSYSPHAKLFVVRRIEDRMR